MTAAAARPTSVAVDRTALGRRGEQIAVDHLRSRGFRVLARNHRTRHGEIDVVVALNGALVFVEVKTRRAPESACHADPSRHPDWPGRGGMGWPGRAQRLRARRLALAWMAGMPPGVPRAREIRFDVVLVVLAADDRTVSLRHVEGAL
jgi:putative endonuclease